MFFEQKSSALLEARVFDLLRCHFTEQKEDYRQTLEQQN